MAPSGRDPAGSSAETRAAGAPAPPRGVAELRDDVLIDLLTLHLYGRPPAEPSLTALVEELARRGERRAMPLLLRACRIFADETAGQAAPELLAALGALGRIGVAEAGEPLAGLVSEGRFGPAGTAAAVAALADLRHRGAAGLIPGLAAHPEAGVRKAACRLAAALGRPEDLEAVLPLATDPDRTVARAAALTLGRLGHRPAKGALEELLVRSTPSDLPLVVEALLPVADEDTAVVLGRVAERSDEAGRLAIAEALGQLGQLPAAVAVLGRLARDVKPSVRLAVAAALALHEPDERTGAVLGALARDQDAAVRAAAEEALKAYEAGW
ncbi:HEAT repeat domain-containing protein [Arenibaculum pallidiluteum]|uniref:HEAT repeat domain-containing protein n=1 Tax=Arenibaculum pallidiluteum TaxID=2812559 RepID=UPI001A975B73|nr:HEAT repeat domain-containing protein [Arenibaculum pallidiluteum]